MKQEKSDVVTEVIDGRRSVYGNPADTFPRVAQIWSGILGTEVQAFHVPLLLMGYKLARTAECPEYSDNSDDIEGYLDTFREVMGDELIHARSVTEFLEKKEQRERQEQAAANRAQVPAFMAREHTAFCVSWNKMWDRAKWPYSCVCSLSEARIGQLEESRARSEKATPTQVHTWSNNHGRSANPQDIHSRECWNHNEHNGPDDPWACICREACRAQHPNEKANLG